MAFARGKYAKAISDRSGMEFPYNEMVKEWNGSTVHISEYEEKHPQLEPLPIIQDPESLENLIAFSIKLINISETILVSKITLSGTS